METVYFSETFVSTYESIRFHNPEQQHRHLHSRENLKSDFVKVTQEAQETLSRILFILFKIKLFHDFGGTAHSDQISSSMDPVIHETHHIDLLLKHSSMALYTTT
jgi:uncharacterized membrane protein